MRIRTSHSKGACGLPEAPILDSRMTIRQLAEHFGLSRARILQIHDRALAKLARHPLMRQMAVDAGLLPEGDA